MSHTPGPWTIYPGRNLHYVNAHPEDYGHVAQRCYYISGPAHSSDFVADVIVTALNPKGEANAKVMLAAPELLEACMTALGAYDVLMKSCLAHQLPGYGECLRELRAVIAKARGESP